jgi:hypothetical protein
MRQVPVAGCCKHPTMFALHMSRLQWAWRWPCFLAVCVVASAFSNHAPVTCWLTSCRAVPAGAPGQVTCHEAQLAVPTGACSRVHLGAVCSCGAGAHVLRRPPASRGFGARVPASRLVPASSRLPKWTGRPAPQAIGRRAAPRAPTAARPCTQACPRVSQARTCCWHCRWRRCWPGPEFHSQARPAHPGPGQPASPPLRRRRARAAPATSSRRALTPAPQWGTSWLS